MQIKINENMGLSMCVSANAEDMKMWGGMKQFSQSSLWVGVMEQENETLEGERLVFKNNIHKIHRKLD